MTADKSRDLKNMNKRTIPSIQIICLGLLLNLLGCQHKKSGVVILPLQKEADGTVEVSQQGPSKSRESYQLVIMGWLTIEGQNKPTWQLDGIPCDDNLIIKSKSLSPDHQQNNQYLLTLTGAIAKDDNQIRCQGEMVVSDGTGQRTALLQFTQIVSASKTLLLPNLSFAAEAGADLPLDSLIACPMGQPRDQRRDCLLPNSEAPRGPPSAEAKGPRQSQPLPG